MMWNPKTMFGVGSDVATGDWNEDGWADLAIGSSGGYRDDSGNDSSTDPGTTYLLFDLPQ